MTIEQKTEKPSLLIRMGLKGCACLPCILMGVTKNKIKQGVSKYFGREIERLPPGQRQTKAFPILSIGANPEYNTTDWSFRIYGEVENPVIFNWDKFNKLPKQQQISDFHCAVGWSKLDVHWGGVPFKSIVELVRPKQDAHFLIAECADGYKTGIPIEYTLKDNVLLALELDGQPISAEHGGPMRLIVPELYAWKSPKFLRGLSFSKTDEAGYWEKRGYHPVGDPWREERLAKK